MSDQFEGREKRYLQGLPAVLNGYVTALCEADAAQKDAQTQRILQLVKSGNVDFRAASTLIGEKEKLETELAVPLLSVTNNQALEVDNSTFKLNMTVSAHQESASSFHADAGGEGKASIGFGPFKASVSVSAHMSTDRSNKRSSDYSSTMDCEITMKQSPPPEGLQIILDALAQNTRAAIAVNQSIMQAKAQVLLENAAAKHAEPKPAQ